MSNDQDEDIATAMAACAAALVVISSYQLSREPFNNSMLTGLEWVFELLTGNERKMRNSLGVTPPSL